MISSAIVILLLHTTTPHQHVKSDTPENYISLKSDEANFLSLLQFIFHPDLGENHLEDFQNEHQLELNIPDFAIAAILIPTIPEIEEKVIHVTPNQFKARDKIYLHQSKLRGPPALS